MAKAKKKSVVKSAAVDKAIMAAIESLNAASEASAVAVATRAKDAKNFTAEGKRLAKKKAALAKRKKTAAVKLKKDGTAAARKSLKDSEKELAVVTKDGAKNRVEKSVNAEELTGLKLGLKKVSAYLKVIEKSDKVLNKPKKKKRKAKRVEPKAV